VGISVSHEKIELIFQEKNFNLNQKLNPEPLAFQEAIQTTTPS
jgi:hypothetical protein